MNTRAKNNIKFYLSLLFFAFVPTIYELIKIRFAGTNSLNLTILGNIEWFDLINETLIAFLITPMYFIINKYYKNKIKVNKESSDELFIFGAIITTVYTLFSIVVYFGVRYFATPMNLTVDTVKYLQFETIAFVFGIIFAYCYVIFVNINSYKTIYILLLTKILLLTISDFIFVPMFKINGIGFSNMLVNLILSAVSLYILFLNKYLSIPRESIDIKEKLSRFMKIGLMQGCSIFIDNVVYIFFICKIVNMYAYQKEYWIANSFIWGYLLIPAIILSEIIKRDTFENKFNIRKYYLFNICLIVFWFITYPTWELFMSNVMLIENTAKVMELLKVLMPFYVAYLFCNVIDSYFIRKGQNYILLKISFYVNCIYYGFIYILKWAHLITIDITALMIIYGMGMIIHMMFDFVYFYKIDKIFSKVHLKQRFFNYLETE